MQMNRYSVRQRRHRTRQARVVLLISLLSSPVFCQLTPPANNAPMELEAAGLTDANRSFGQGVRGYAHYFATSYADYVIGDYMTEATFPTTLHQDPRYFRRGTGSGWSRFGQIFWTHNDSGRRQFNFPEILGNSTAVAISMADYPENRDAADGVSEPGSQPGVDMVSNILKEIPAGYRTEIFT